MCYLIFSVFKVTFMMLQEHVWPKWSFRGILTSQSKEAGFLRNLEEIKVVILIKQKSKGNPLYAHGNIIRL